MAILSIAIYNANNTNANYHKHDSRTSSYKYSNTVLKGPYNQVDRRLSTATVQMSGTINAHGTVTSSQQSTLTTALKSSSVFRKFDQPVHKVQTKTPQLTERFTNICSREMLTGRSEDNCSLDNSIVQWAIGVSEIIYTTK